VEAKKFRQWSLYIEQLWKYAGSVYSSCLSLRQSNVSSMIWMSAEASARNGRPESFNSWDWLPSCRDTKNKLDIRILPPICQFTLQLLLNGLVQEPEKIAIPSQYVKRHSFNTWDQDLQLLNFLHRCWT
jgi:hypothetical protein